LLEAIYLRDTINDQFKEILNMSVIFCFPKNTEPAAGTPTTAGIINLFHRDQLIQIDEINNIYKNIDKKIA
jgi:hypothetical protein